LEFYIHHWPVSSTYSETSASPWKRLLGCPSIKQAQLPKSSILPIANTVLADTDILHNVDRARDNHCRLLFGQHCSNSSDASYHHFHSSLVMCRSLATTDLYIPHNLQLCPLRRKICRMPGCKSNPTRLLPWSLSKWPPPGHNHTVSKAS
jgi:hypothetical protein